MLFRICIAAYLLTYLLGGSNITAASGQTSEPEREELLNGLRILLWHRTGDQNVLMKLRIHSGAAFDLAGKAGGMALLGDILFPDSAIRDYFEDMDGQIDVVTNHDSITITMLGHASEFERMTELLRTALVTPQITPENVDRVRNRRLEMIRATTDSPAALADRSIAARLLHDFPYARPYTGSLDSLAEVERADLMLAHERFLNPNNSTLAIVGGVERPRAMRALRQLLGVWRMSEKVVPATFRQPEDPDPRPLLVDAPNVGNAEIRLATRGLSRSDSEYISARILAVITKKRWESSAPELLKGSVSVRHLSYVLPGIFVMEASVNTAGISKAVESGQAVLRSLTESIILPTELQEAKKVILAELASRMANQDGMVEAWLDIDTYGLPPIAEQLKAAENVTGNDIKRTAERLFKKGGIGAVVVGDARLIRPELERTMKIEVPEPANPRSSPPEAKTPNSPGTVKPD